MPDQSHLTSLLFSTPLPAGFLAVLSFGEYCFKRFRPSIRDSEPNQKALHVAFANVRLWTLFIIYPSVSKTILRTFGTVCFDDGKCFIQTDLQISTSTSLYSGLFAFALFCVLFYIVGVPLMFAVMLDRQRTELNAVSFRL